MVCFCSTSLAKKNSEKEKKIFSALWMLFFFCRGGLETNSNCPPLPNHPAPEYSLPLHSGLAPQPGSTPSRGRRTLMALPGPPCLPPAWMLPVTDSTSFHGRSWKEPWEFPGQNSFFPPWSLRRRRQTWWEVPSDGLSIPLSLGWWQSQWIPPAFTCPLTLSFSFWWVWQWKGVWRQLCTCKVCHGHIL